MTTPRQPADETSAARPIGCSELKAAMSAYIDDELTRDERLRADAHIVACGSCRDLVERAERLDDTLREHFDLELEQAAGEIPADSVDTRAMQAQVLASIGGGTRPRWMPRLAIAAGVAIAAIATIAFWRAGGSPSSLAPAEPGQFASRPTTRDGLPSPVPAPRESAMQLASLDADERQLLYSTSVILTNLRKADFEHSGNRTQLREFARYDELVQRLDALLSKVPPADRPTVALARDSIEFLLDASADSTRWEDLRRDIERTEIDLKLDALSET